MDRFTTAPSCPPFFAGAGAQTSCSSSGQDGLGREPLQSQDTELSMSRATLIQMV